MCGMHHGANEGHGFSVWGLQPSLQGHIWRGLGERREGGSSITGMGRQ